MDTTPFIQTIDFRTSEPERISQLEDEWEKRASDRSTARRVLLTRDRDEPDHYRMIVFFDSYESAMENSALPETHEMAEKMSAAANGTEVFTNLDVIEERS